MALFRVLSALAIVKYLNVGEGPLIALVVFPFAAALLLGYRTQLVATVLLIIALVLMISNWDSLSSISDQTIWMAITCCWCAGLPVNAQWSVDAALVTKLKNQPNATDTLPSRTHAVQSPLSALVAILVVVMVVITAIGHSQKVNLFMFSAVLLLIPAAPWQDLFTRLKATSQHKRLQKLIIFYDADCGFCLKMCLILRELLLCRDTNILTAQSDTQILPILEANNSWVIQSENGNTHIHWHAMQHLFMQRWPFKLIGWLMNLPPLMKLGNSVYEWVANNRTKMSQITAWALPWGKLELTPTPLTIVWVGLLSITLTLLQLMAGAL